MDVVEAERVIELQRMTDERMASNKNADIAFVYNKQRIEFDAQTTVRNSLREEQQGVHKRAVARAMRKEGKYDDHTKAVSRACFDKGLEERERRQRKLFDFESQRNKVLSPLSLPRLCLPVSTNEHVEQGCRGRP